MTGQPFHVRFGLNADGQRLMSVADAIAQDDAVTLQQLQANAGVKFAARVGNLPSPTDPDPTKRPLAGQPYLVKLDLNGQPMDRIAVWDSTGPATGGVAAVDVVEPAADAAVITAAAGTSDPGNLFDVNGGTGAVLDLLANADGSITATVTAPGTGYAIGDTLSLPAASLAWPGMTGVTTITVISLTGASATGGWRFVDPQIWLKAQRSLADPPPGAMAGDLVTVTEKDHEQLKVWTGSAWLTLFDVDSIKGWISSLNLFQGTVQETGGTTIGTIQMNALPDITVAATGAQHASQYWVWTGQAGYVIKAADPKGIGADLATVVMQVGDWLQVSSKTGTNPGDPVTYHWSHIGGDLLARSRADSLFGLNPWAAGNYEKGSLVVYQGAIYRATGPVAPTDTAPGTVASAGPPVVTAAPWALIPLTAGVKNVPADANLPATAPGSDVYLVLNSAKAGGKPALFSYDVAASRWVQLGGSTGTGIDLSGGQMMIGVGCPIGSVMAWLTATAPPGWLLCDGQNISQTLYPELFALLGTKVPDLRGAFLRGAGLNVNPTWGSATRAVNSWQEDTTRMPRVTPFTATARPEGDHTHVVASEGEDLGGGSGNLVLTTRGGQSYWGARSGGGGSHGHSITVAGGDTETAPKNYAVNYIVKAIEIGIRYRAATP
jgi:hypothetical protein